VGNLSRGHAGAQGAFGPIVGRLGTLGLIEEGQQTAPGVMPANLVEQALVVGVVQGPWLEMSINGLRDVLCFAGVVVYSPGMIALPQRDGIFRQRAVGMHHAALIRWDELADLLVAMT